MKILTLQTAYCTQQEGAEGEQWQVLNTEEELLALLPRDLSPREAMSYLHFARPFERQAFDQGVAQGRSEERKVSGNEKAQLELTIQILRNENERLADVLDTHINQT